LNNGYDKVTSMSVFPAQGTGVTFEIGDEIQPQQPSGQEEDDLGWECVWSCHTATPVFHMSFSPDGTLFATAGKSDRLVKIWFENKQCKFHICYCGSACCIAAVSMV
jgi:WD40 repeat protein